MAAANAVMDLVPPGAVVVAPSAAYTGVAVRLRELDAIGRISLRIVDADDTDGVAAACAGAHLLWLESPTNPLLQVADLPACIAAAHAAGAQVLVDNTFATPDPPDPARPRRRPRPAQRHEVPQRPLGPADGRDRGA